MSITFLPFQKQLLPKENQIPPLNFLSGPFAPPPLDLDTNPAFLPLPVTHAFIAWLTKWCANKNIKFPININKDSIVIVDSNLKIILVRNPDMILYAQIDLPDRLFGLIHYVEYDMTKSIRFSPEQLRDMIYPEFHNMSLRNYILDKTGDTCLYSTFVYKKDSIWELLHYDGSEYKINFALDRMNCRTDYPQLFRWFNEGLYIILVITGTECHCVPTQLILKLVRTDKLVCNLNSICTNSVRQSSIYLSNLFEINTGDMYQFTKEKNNSVDPNIIFRYWRDDNTNVDLNNLLCSLILGMERRTDTSTVYIDDFLQIAEQLVIPSA